jgi:signal transduction histidine kinase
MRGPAWSSSVRARLTGLYSLVLFTLMSGVLALIYAGVREDISDEPIATSLKVAGQKLDGSQLLVEEAGQYTQFEQVVAEHTLGTLREAALLSLGALGLASLVVGWVLAGRALRPVARITDVAANIEGDDLSRRISLAGPDDELKRMADTFDRMLDRVSAAFEAQHQLVDDASHELRNPLAVMRTSLDVALREPDPSAAHLRETVAVTSRAVDRMSRQVDDLLATARRPGAGHREDDVDVRALLQDVAEEYADSARLRPLTVTAHAPQDLTLSADAPALGRAVGNLVSNAVRLAPEDSQVTLAAGRDGAWTWLAVADEGPGIPADQHERVFERAWSAHHSSGLGLAIVRQIVESQGGVVRLHSAPGRGSTFVLWLKGRGAPDVLWAPPANDPMLPPTEAASRR